MTLQGKSIEDARKSGASGCVEAGAFGRESYILTGYFNMPKVLEITLHNGVDPMTGKQIGIQTGDPVTFTHFDDLFEAFRKQLDHFIDIKIKGNNIIEQINAGYMPVPLLSLVTEDCIFNGSVTDSLTALKYLVFDEKSISMEKMLTALKNNFKGEDILFHQIDKAPKYGNDNDLSDEILQKVFQAYHGSINERPNHRGGAFRVNLLPTTCHVYFGEVTGAMPDGRKKGQPLSEGISPVQGADRNGPTAVLKSAAKIDHLKTGGTLLNQKFLPDLLKDDKGMTALMHLIRSYFKMDGHHVQFNVVSKQTLEEAKKHPENYQDLIVRVAGYSDYFVDLTPALQDEIILRTGHQGF
jgi:formate C-acetyltransferase